MVITHGEKAADMLRTVNSQVTENHRIYDYYIANGAVLIRKADKQCLYIKAKGKDTYALDGTVDEFRALFNLTGERDLKDIVTCAEEII